MAPPGTAPAIEFSKVAPRKSSSKPTPAASSRPPLDATTSDAERVVEFTSAHDLDNESDSKRSHYGSSDGDDGAQPRKLIEDIYGVEQRQYQPAKKRKLDEVDPNPASMTRPMMISEHTGLGEFIKEGVSQPPAIQNASTVVDLTDDDTTIPKDDDELQVTGFTDLSLQRICYGKIESALVNASKVPRPKTKSLFSDQWPPIKIEMLREPRRGDSRINVVDPYGEVFGTVDAKTAQVLCLFMDSPAINLQIAGRLDSRNVFAGEEPGVAVSTQYRVSLTLYGERRRAEQIGRILSQHNVWLVTPNFVEAGIPLFNPHAERRRAIAESGGMNNPGRDRQASGIRYEARTAEQVTDSVTMMFNQLISAEMEEMDQPDAVKTPLLSHQKQALWFMMKKEEPRTFKTETSEDNSLWRAEYQANGRKQYKEIITGLVSDSEPPQVLGGLLADEMGLGKTLSILSLTMKTLPQSKEWAQEMTSHELIARVPGIRNTRTTLLVVPVTAVQNWVSQIQEHLEPQSLKYYVFHGPSRTTNFHELEKYDLVITTYHTILSEISDRNPKRKASSPLTKMCMFRIVLDEAHIIRGQGTQLTQATLALHAQRHWSVTGTPVQNRLDDLLSIIKFLKLHPYDEGQSFRQHILNPMKTGCPNALKSLRVLVDSFTLRRVKDKINLPPREDKVIYLEFSEEEKQVHDFFRVESQGMMRVIAGESRTKLGGRMFHHVLKAMMILRQVSAHGKELLDIEDRERAKGLSMNDAIDLEENESDNSGLATDKKAYSMFSLMQESGADQCARCNKRLEESASESGSEETDSTTPMAFFLPCWDLLCPECFKSWIHDPESRGSDKSIRCQVCEGWILRTSSTITPAGLDDYLAQKAQERQSRRSTKMFGEYEGPHTKTRALVQHLLESAAESAQMPEEPPIKTVVFSVWTSHLDLIEIALRANGLDGFKRLDGTMSLSQRTKTLEAFAKDDSVTILLATLGAGGVGLNLTSASRVIVMEPHYNPAAVAQAVDRVHRLGQTRPVQTVLLIMKESIEEKILELNKKKQQLADMSMNRKRSKKEVQEQRMEEHRALFQ